METEEIIKILKRTEEHLMYDRCCNAIVNLRGLITELENKKRNFPYFNYIDLRNYSEDLGETPEDILEEAQRITSGDRQAQYGPADQDFKRTAQMWSAIKGVEFAAREVAMFLICLKLSRETHQKKRDNWVDIAGYAKCGSICED